MRVFILLVFTFLIGSNFQSQVDQGVLRVTAYQNDTGNLKDNQTLDSINVQIISSNDTINCVIPSSGEGRNRCLLSAGTYKLRCIIDGTKEIVIEKVIIRSDTISSVDILFEPEQELNFCEKRKRNKLFANEFE